VIPKSKKLKRMEESFDSLFDFHRVDFALIKSLMGVEGKRGVRNLETRDCLGLDNLNEEVREPWFYSQTEYNNFSSSCSGSSGFSSSGLSPLPVLAFKCSGQNILHNPVVSLNTLDFRKSSVQPK